MPTKNTNTNNNIIQILLENKKSKRRKKESSKSQSTPTSYMKDSQMQTRPLNLVNSFPSSSRLDDQAGRVRFMDAMRDPFSTKTPYSIYDNGSNTFARQGETVGAEVPISPQLRPDDYFEEPIRQSARQFSNPRRFDIRDEVSDISDLSTVSSNSYNLSDISDVSELSAFPFPLRRVKQESVNSFPGIPLYQSTDESKYDDWVDPTQQGEQENEEDKFGISGAQYFQPEQTRFSETVEPAPAFSTPYRPQAEPKTGGETGETELRHRSQKLDRDMEFYEDAINEIDREFRNLDMMKEGGGEIESATRFSETVEPPPAFATPYRPQAEEVGERIDKLIGKIDSVSSKIGKKQQKEPEEIIEEEVAEVPPPTMEEIREQRAKRAEEEKKQKGMIQKFTDLKTKLELLRQTKTDLYSKVNKDKPIRKEIQELIKSDDYGFEGRTNIGKITKIDTFIKMLEKGSRVHIEKLKNLEAHTTVAYDSGRNPPTTSGNIQTFAKTAGGGAGGGAVASRI